MAKHGPTRINIEVTPADIEQAHIGDSYKCVVAQAVARTVPSATRIEVDVQTIRFTRDGERLSYLTPYAVAGYVVAFDAGDEITPFQFQLRNPIKSRTVVKTAAGREIARKENRARTARKRARDAEAIRPTAKVKSQALEQFIEEAPGRAEAAEKEVADARAAYREAGIPLAHESGRRIPTVHKTKKRSYGHRLLRVNQADGRKHFA